MVSKVNPYISNYDNITCSEKQITDDLIIETIQNWGQTFHYIPRVSFGNDQIWGEDKDAEFQKATCIEMLLESVDGFEGEGDYLSQWGVEIRDSATVVVSKTRWKEEFPELPDPKEGDLLYYPMTKGLFQINYVSHRDPFFQLGKNFVYKLKIERFEYGWESMDTGITEVDSLNDLFDEDESSINIVPENNNDTKAIKDKAISINYFDINDPFDDNSNCE